MHQALTQIGEEQDREHQCTDDENPTHGGCARFFLSQGIEVTVVGLGQIPDLFGPQPCNDRRGREEHGGEANQDRQRHPKFGFLHQANQAVEPPIGGVNAFE